MAQPSTIANHPRRPEIDAAIVDGRSNRRIAATFGLSEAAVRRYRSGAAKRSEGAATRCTTPSEIPSAPVSPTGMAAAHPTPDPFDLLDVHYPWRPDEAPQPDPLAEVLRQTQSRFGRDAVKAACLSIIGQHRAGVTDVVIARKLDVPPPYVSAWRLEEEREALARLSRDPKSLLARELAALEARERAVWQKIETAGAQVGGRTWTAAQSTLNVLFRQRMDLRKEAGVSLELPAPPEPPNDERGLARVVSLKGSLAAFMVAAGIDPSTPFEEAVDELPGRLDENFGPVGSPERSRAAQQIVAPLGAPAKS